MAEERRDPLLAAVLAACGVVAASLAHFALVYLMPAVHKGAREIGLAIPERVAALVEVIGPLPFLALGIALIGAAGTWQGAKGARAALGVLLAGVGLFLIVAYARNHSPFELTFGATWIACAAVIFVGTLVLRRRLLIWAAGQLLGLALLFFALDREMSLVGLGLLVLFAAFGAVAVRRWPRLFAGVALTLSGFVLALTLALVIELRVACARTSGLYASGLQDASLDLTGRGDLAREAIAEVQASFTRSAKGGQLLYSGPGVNKRVMPEIVLPAPGAAPVFYPEEPSPDRSWPLYEGPEGATLGYYLSIAPARPGDRDVPNLYEVVVTVGTRRIVNGREQLWDSDNFGTWVCR